MLVTASIKDETIDSRVVDQSDILQALSDNLCETPTCCAIRNPERIETHQNRETLKDRIHESLLYSESSTSSKSPEALCESSKIEITGLESKLSIFFADSHVGR